MRTLKLIIKSLLLFLKNANCTICNILYFFATGLEHSHVIFVQINPCSFPHFSDKKWRGKICLLCPSGQKPPHSSFFVLYKLFYIRKLYIYVSTSKVSKSSNTRDLIMRTGITFRFLFSPVFSLPKTTTREVKLQRMSTIFLTIRFSYHCKILVKFTYCS